MIKFLKWHVELAEDYKPGRKLIMVNMSKENNNKTTYEKLYEKGLLGFASGSCSPVIMKPLLEEGGFKNLTRIYRKNKSLYPINRMFGSEIVFGQK